MPMNWQVRLGYQRRIEINWSKIGCLAMGFTLTPNTAYASSDRERYEDVLADYESIAGSETAVLDSFQDPLIVLNEKRQIVFMNRAFMRFLELDRQSEILGNRLGEVLGCTQSLEDVERENLAADVESLTQCWQP
jgi:PAS domain-containing protein